VNVRRNDQDERDGFGSATAQLPFTATALHNAQKPVDAKTSDDSGGISMFWRVFGGTIISIVALVGITLYNSMNTQISELRGEIHKLNEARAEFIKKDEFGNRVNSTWDRVQLLQTQNNEQNASMRALRAELDAYKEKMTRTGMDLDAAKKDLAAIEVLKEKITNLATDMKSTRDEALKLRQDVDKNLTADADRKTRRDEQYKEIDKAIKEQAAALQALQIKLARLEGATEKPVEKPAKPAETKPPVPEKKDGDK
jgi:nitrogen fixation/metabolism regulation signal transduction histidine kinase